MNDYVEKRPELVGISDYTRAWQNDLPFASDANNGAQMNPLDVIDTSAPQLSDAEVALLIKTEYGLDGQLRSLLSERDQNFRLTANDGQRYVVKIAGAAENQKTADFQIQALLHLEARGCKAAVPKIRRTRDGASSTTILHGETRHIVRLVSYLNGRVLSDVSPTPALMRSIGQSLAYLDIALSDFDSDGDQPPLLWDMQRASDLVPLTTHIPDAALRQTVLACFDDFQQIAEPQFASLRHQVIHNDINPDNVLVEEKDTESVAGIIDFSDMLRAPLVVELGIAASYLRCDGADALADIASFIAAYDRISPLEDVEIDLLYDLVRTRLVTTMTMLYWRLATKGNDDDYVQESLLSESGAERFLTRINAMTRKAFSDRLRQECGH
jgi:hydroxylysine kinase